MANITSLIFVHGTQDEANASRFADEFRSITGQIWGANLSDAEGVGGLRDLENFVYLAGVKNLTREMKDQLVMALMDRPWKWPEDVVLILSNEDTEIFRPQVNRTLEEALQVASPWRTFVYRVHVDGEDHYRTEPTAAEALEWFCKANIAPLSTDVSDLWVRQPNYYAPKELPLRVVQGGYVRVTNTLRADGGLL